MAAVLLYALITNFLGAKYLHELDYLISTSSHTSQKQFGHHALLTSFICPGMVMQQGSDKQFTKTDRRGGRLLITFCLLLAGDVHQCPGPMFHTELATKSPKPDMATTSQSPGLQIQTAVNIVQKSLDHPPSCRACSSDGSGGISTTITTRAGSRGMSGMEEAEEPRSLKWCTSSIISVEVAWQQIHHTDDSVSSDKAGGVSSSRVMIAQSSCSAQPADLCPPNSDLPVNALNGPGQQGPIKNPRRTGVSATQRRGAGLNPAIIKLRKFDLFQTVNNAKVLWDPQAKPSGLLGGHLNICSFISKSDEIKHILVDSNLDFLCLSETWLNKNSPSTALHIPGYNAFRKDRKVGKGGGLLLYIKEHI